MNTRKSKQEQISAYWYIRHIPTNALYTSDIKVGTRQEFEDAERLAKGAVNNELKWFQFTETRPNGEKFITHLGPSILKDCAISLVIEE